MIGLDGFYQALSSIAQGINNIATKLTATINSSNQIATATTITSIPTLSVNTVNVDTTPSSYYPPSATVMTASSTVASNTVATATLAGTTNLLTWIEGFDVTSSGATSAAVATITVTGVAGGTLRYVYPCVAGVTTANATFNLRMPNPKPASTNATAISVSLSALGTGSTAAAVVVYGYQL